MLTPAAGEDEIDHYVNLHRLALQEASFRALDAELWREGYALSLRDLYINRFSFYLIAHTFRHYPFMERAFRTLRHLLDIEAQRGQSPPSD